MTRERIELNGQDDSGNSPRVRPLRGRGSEFSATDDGEDLSSRVIDLEIEDEAQFLRTQKRVPVRRGPLARKAANRVKLGVKIAAVAGVLTVVAVSTYGYASHAARFRIESSDDIEISGVRNVSRAQVMEIAGSDIGRNIFFVPLDERRRQLERIPWIESASVMRLLPNRIAVNLAERTPVAKVQIGPKINLIDAGGIVLGPPANRQTRYSFPVIHGITESEPLSSRAAVMKIYGRLIRELDSDSAEQFTRQISEVDLSDPEDVKVTASDAAGTVVIHLGNSDFLARYKIFADHVGEWRKQAGSLQSVDLRYEGQVIVNPDIEKSGDRAIGRPPQPTNTARSGDPGGSGDLKPKPYPKPIRTVKKKKTDNQKPKVKAKAKSQTRS